VSFDHAHGVLMQLKMNERVCQGRIEKDLRSGVADAAEKQVQVENASQVWRSITPAGKKFTPARRASEGISAIDSSPSLGRRAGVGGSFVPG
jgi:hypothetical protein